MTKQNKNKKLKIGDIVKFLYPHPSNIHVKGIILEKGHPNGPDYWVYWFHWNLKSKHCYYRLRKI